MDFPFATLTPDSPATALFAQLFDLLPQGVAVYDADHRVVYYNRALGLMDEFDPAEVIGRPADELFRPFDSKGFLSLRCLKTRRAFVNQPLFYYTRLGRLVNTIHNIFPLTHGDQVIGCVCFVREYSDVAVPAAAGGEASAGGKKTVSGGTRFTIDQIITMNPAMRRAMEVVARAADSESSIMIYGETGSGKEVFAQSAHNMSRRARRPFMAVSCAAIPENLLEGLLFGTAKGAFTGAHDKPGLMEMADGGTLFLDEINSMPLGLQGKMLRAIQERAVKRVGGAKEIPVSLKIISATNNHPHRAVTEGQLRPDLLYRLGVVIVDIPPLRHRKEDIEPLCDHFIGKFNQKLGKNVTGLDPAMHEAFEKHYWPGNVRELEHVIESAMNLVSPSETILEPPHFSSSLLFSQVSGDPAAARPEARPAAAPPRGARESETEEAARIIKALEEADGNAAKAARSLSISPQLMHHKMKKYGLKKCVVVKRDS